MRWTSHLARRHPWKLVITIAACGLACTGGYSFLGPFGAVAVGVMMLGAIADFVLPVEHTLTRSGARTRTLLRTLSVEWNGVRNCYLDDFGVKLSSLGGRTRLEAFKGVYLRFSDNREQVMDMVKSLWRNAQ